MLDLSSRCRPLLCLALAVPPVFWGPPAAALDKAACVAAAEEGQRLRRQGLLIAARSQFESCASPDCPDVVSRDCVGWLREVDAVLASLVVTAHDARGGALTDVNVIVDGSALPQHPPTTAIDLPPGQHVVRCERAGFEPWEAHIELAEGERNHTIACELAPSAPARAATARAPSPRSILTAPVPTQASPPEAPPGGVSWIVWPLAGIGAAGIGTFTGFAVAGQNEEAVLKQKCAPYCVASDTNPVATKFTIADVSLGVGVVALGAAVVLILLRPSATHRAH